MALRRAVQFIFILVVIRLSVQVQENNESVTDFFEPMLGTNTSREKSAGPFTVLPPPNSNDYELLVVLNISEVETLQTLLNLMWFPFPYGSAVFTSIDTTTVCALNVTSYQCTCEESFAWSYNSCIKHGACDAITGNTCGCINDLPADDQYCRSTTNHSEPTHVEAVLEFHIPVSSAPPNVFDHIRFTLGSVYFPLHITRDLEIIDANFTTGCFPNSSRGLQCQCEDQFAWSCDKCGLYGTCSNTNGRSCRCINGLPPNEEYCEPISTVAQCRSPETRTFSFSINMPFDPAYNNKDSQVYKDVDSAIQAQCAKHIPTLIAARLNRFRRGSTIATYTVTAASLKNAQIEAVKVGMFKQLSPKYPITFDSSTLLKFDPPEVFSGRSMTVTCGPPPRAISFGTNWTAEWTLNGALVLEDTLHIFSSQGGAAILTIPSFFSADDGSYDCKLTRINGSVFRQSGTLFSKEIPSLRVSPVRETVKCEVGTVRLECSVNSPYTVQFLNFPAAGTGNTVSFQFTIPSDCTTGERKFTCQSQTNPVFGKEIAIQFTSGDIICVDAEFGNGTLDYRAIAPCSPDKEGQRTAVCKENGKFEDIEDSCVLRPILTLFNESQLLNENNLAKFLDKLSNTTRSLTEEVVVSPPTMGVLSEIFDNVANASSSLQISINRTSMEDVLLTADVLTIDSAKASWDFLNANDTRNTSAENRKSVSSLLLQSLETITSGLTNDTFEISTPSILLNRTTFTNNFNADFNSSVEVDIPQTDGGNKSITVITFSSMDNVLPARDQANSSTNAINGRVVLIQSSGEINNLSLTFDILNDTLGDPKCVFWNFSLFEGLGGWDDEGCILVFNENETVSCNCNHLTSFSILMSPFAPNNPILDYITYIGVGLSMASLVICLIIEGIIWRKIGKNDTSHLRHVSIVNIAISLLIANIWFIIGAAIADADQKNPPACTAATFFIHFFYLALFFWMLASGLLLLYRMLSVFGGGLSKAAMLAIGFCLGYGAPLIIAVITIAVTAPAKEYIRANTVCWLNWDESKALLAFVIPALVIVVINLIILLVVIYKMLRSRVRASATQPGERHVLMVIARSLAVLTPIFGLTWGLGVGTMTDPNNEGIHIAFAFFNSLQGFFILVFGTLLDKKAMSELKASQTSTSGAKSTSGGTSSTSGWGKKGRNKGKGGYNISSNLSQQSESS
ncbi:adhesion G-protein coupled receptor F1-like isoform X2 [Cololabis saira]|uniref:adhesion G-protein coupled receptor F1-like isoform X2 n=1 Tax=Cololabis saira TaxID=129043 RepID=UPI002AD35AE2|nr:adhesion G-protein coupled receptor F1-like isoform X2 [Cololabis saira]